MNTLEELLERLNPASQHNDREVRFRFNKNHSIVLENQSVLRNAIANAIHLCYFTVRDNCYDDDLYINQFCLTLSQRQDGKCISGCVIEGCLDCCRIRVQFLRMCIGVIILIMSAA
jgi:hypothetical protein